MGRQVCTILDFTKHNAVMKLGPDGPNWELLSDAEVTALTGNAKITYKHNAVAKLSHLCAGQGGWAFTLPGLDNLLPQAVAFLYIKQPSALAGMAGGGGVTMTYNGAAIKRGYDAAAAVWGSRVWRREHKNGAIEIAINFCVS